MTGGVRSHLDLAGDLKLKADVVIVGTGAGGAVAALRLAEAGLSVIALEAGQHFLPQQFDHDVLRAVKDVYWNQGNLGPEDGSLRISQGRGVGGSTLLHMLTMDPLRDFTLERWRDRLGLKSFTSDGMAGITEYLVRKMNIRPVEWARVNANARRFVAGCEALGLSWRLNNRNAGNCVGAGRCHLGCPFGGKNSMDRAFIPGAVEAGLQLLTDSWAQQVVVEAGRAVGVRAEVREPSSHRATARLEVRAPAVLLAAGATQTPTLLLRSGLQTDAGMVGRQLHVQPGVTILGEFDQEIRGWEGITNPVHIDQWIHPDNGGFFCEPGLINASILASGMPGLGEDHAHWMARWKHFAGGEVLLDDAGRNDEGEASHRLDLDDAGNTRIRYVLTQEDRKRMRTALRRIGEVLFAGGARRVFVAHRQAVHFESPAALAALEALPFGPNDVVLNSVHVQATCPMSLGSAAGVVAESGECHHVRGLYIADASAFPTGVGSNTTLPAATFGYRTAESVRTALGR